MLHPTETFSIFADEKYLLRAISSYASRKNQKKPNKNNKQEQQQQQKKPHTKPTTNNKTHLVQLFLTGNKPKNLLF